MDAPNTSAIERAVSLADGVANLADACGVSVQAVYKWIKKGHPPTDRCEAVELAVQGRVSRFELLPPAFASKPRVTPSPPPKKARHKRAPTS